MIYKLVGCDTDSIKFCRKDNKPMAIDEIENIIGKMNKATPSGILLEEDGYYDKFLVIKSKNYVTVKKDKITYMGSSITDQKKEPKLKEFINGIIDILLNYGEDYKKINDLYIDYCKQALNPENIKDWCVKLTVSSKMISGSTVAGQKAYDACLDAIKNKVIGGIQEGDKIWVYTAIDGEKQKEVKGEPVFLKDGTPKMIKNSILKFPQLYSDNHDKWHYVGRVYSTLKIFETILDMDKFIKFANKTNQKKLLKYVESS